jgi:TRAP-type mannitol/chloroaromatic compound transport system permease large subunit
MLDGLRPAMLAPVILIGGMVSGIFSPTESAAVAVAYVFVLGIFAYKELNLRNIYQVLVKTAYSTATILFVTAAAFLLSWVVAVERVPDMMEQMLLGITTSPYVLLLIMNLVVLAIGCLINPVPAILLFSPILLPALVAVGCICLQSYDRSDHSPSGNVTLSCEQCSRRKGRECAEAGFSALHTSSGGSSLADICSSNISVRA